MLPRSRGQEQDKADENAEWDRVVAARQVPRNVELPEPVDVAAAAAQPHATLDDIGDELAALRHAVDLLGAQLNRLSRRVAKVADSNAPAPPTPAAPPITLGEDQLAAIADAVVERLAGVEFEGAPAVFRLRERPVGETDL